MRMKLHTLAYVWVLLQMCAGGLNAAHKRSPPVPLGCTVKAPCEAPEEGGSKSW